MPTNVIMPQMGESIAEGTITKWMKKVGERVDRDEPLFEISTDKVDAEIPSPAAGVLTQILVKENETVAINTVVAVVDGEGAGVAAPTPAEAAAPQSGSALSGSARPSYPGPADGRYAPAPEEQEGGEGGDVRTSPLVRRIAREHNVDLSEVKGTGLGGRVSKKDILDFIDQRRAGAPPQPAAAPAPSAPPVAQTTPPPVAFTGATQIVPMTPMRRQIAEHMVMSKHTSAHVYTLVEVEMTRVVATRERFKQEFEQRNGIKLTFTPFFVRASVEAIKELPDHQFFRGRDQHHLQARREHRHRRGAGKRLDRAGHQARGREEFPGRRARRAGSCRPRTLQALERGRCPGRDLHHYQSGQFRRVVRLAHHQSAPGGHPGSGRH